MLTPTRIALTALVMTAVPLAAAAGNPLSGSAAVQTHAFFSDGADPRQDSGLSLSVSLEPEFRRDWDGGRQSFTFTPFARIDRRDDERSHADVRELYWRQAGEAHELRLGVRRLFWGVTESQHLVDIINQDDFVENIDGEDKLGQPMVNLAVIGGRWGMLDLFLLPYFRERTFPGPEGRLRPQPPVDDDDARYESGRERHHPDLALRWFGTLGRFDLGLSWFRGTNRDPRLLLEPGTPELRRPPGCAADASDPACQPRVFLPQAQLLPQYDQIRQLGLDLQANVNGWALKLEAIHRDSHAEDFTAAVGGFEYTVVGVFGTQLDLGLLAEYLYDSRGALSEGSLQAQAQRRLQAGEGFTLAEAAALRTLQPQTVSAFQNDVFVGTRLVFNDVQGTDLLIGVIVDADTQASFGSIEGGRRLGADWKLSLESRFFAGIGAADPLYSLRRDDYLQLELTRYF